MTVLKKLSLSILLYGLVLFANAQPGPQPPNPPADPDVVPITGLEYLLIGGGIYGVSKLMRKGKSKDAKM